MAESDPAVRIEVVTGREASVGALLAASFVDSPSPVLSRLAPTRRFALLRSLLTAATRDVSRHGQALVAVETATVDLTARITAGAGEPGPTSTAGRLLGALLLMPPGSFPASLRRRVRTAPSTLRAICLAPRHYPAWRRSVTARSATLPPAGDWWLIHTIAVDPRAHRRGVGRALLQRGLDAVDETGLPCYLHTASPAAAALFRGFGFVVDGPPIRAHSTGPPYLKMARPGRADR